MNQYTDSAPWSGAWRTFIKAFQTRVSVSSSQSSSSKSSTNVKQNQVGWATMSLKKATAKNAVPIKATMELMKAIERCFTSLTPLKTFQMQMEMEEDGLRAEIFISSSSDATSSTCTLNKSKSRLDNGCSMC